MYNCTTAANLWDLLVDSNVLKLEGFRQVGPTEVNDSSISGLGDNTTEGNRTVVATASIHVADCVLVQDSSVGRPVIGNSFFDPKFENDPVYFYTAGSAVVATSNNNTDAASSEGCVLELQLLRANLTEVYPNCKIKFQSTDLNNLGLSAGTATTHPASPNATVSSTTRRLDASSFGFLKDWRCSYDCGDAGADPDQCYAPIDDKWTLLQCTMQFYSKNSACSSECGDKVGFPLYEDPLPPNQCYDCYETAWWCKSGYYAANAAGCCRVLTCPAISDTTMTSPADLKWNLEDDKTTISDPSLVLFEDGDCSDRSDPRSDCCRITCENCYVLISVASLYADVDAFALNDYTTTAEMKLVGSSELKVKIFAPNGCRLTLTENMFDETATIPLSTGIDLEIQVALDILRELRLQPHGTSVEFGVVTAIEGLTAGYVDSEEFFDLQIKSRPADDLAQSGIDIELELDVIPTVRASLSLLGGTAKIGVKATVAVFVELEAGIQFPEPYSGLSTEYLDSTSFFHLGDCSQQHFMEFNGFAGYKDVYLTLPMSLDLYFISKSAEPILYSGSAAHRQSLFSGCIAAVYDAQVMLSTALDTISALSEEKQEQLKKIIMWALGLSEIDPNFLTINSISDTTGEISIQIAVPPAVADKYPTSHELEATFYERARTASFSSAVSTFVGIGIASQCDDGWWGPTCTNRCHSSYCTGSLICNAADGTVTSCSQCLDGYWGATCSEYCDLPTNCESVRCDQDSGDAIECTSCDDSYWGTLCSYACRVPENCETARCDRYGTTTSCDYNCKDGWWGYDCSDECYSSHCAYGSHVSCDSRYGSASWCSSCNDGWWGQSCTDRCTSSHCTEDSVTCEKAYGSGLTCTNCEDGYWGSTCESSCTTPANCASARCNLDSGDNIECTECISGFWGSTCTNSCEVPQHCVSAQCRQYSKTATRCVSCQVGWTGDLCETTSTSAPTATPATGTASTGTGTSSGASTRCLSLWLALTLVALGLIKML